MLVKLHHTLTISKEQYKLYENLEYLTGKQCYDKYGLKDSEGYSHTFYFLDRFELVLAQVVPYQEELTTQAYASLHDTYTDTWYDCDECGDTILGEWYFVISDNEELYVTVRFE